MNDLLPLSNNPLTRRNFVRHSARIASLLPLLSAPQRPNADPPPDLPPKVHLFSKHLQFLDYQDMADAAAEMGFDGIDLTVRPKGHVLPERVSEDLPKAIDAMRQAGLAPSMMTTAVRDPDDPTDRKVLEVAAQLGMQYYRMNYFHYADGKSIPESVREFRQQLKALSKLNSDLGIIGCYQNHAGNYVGASIWELWELLKDADPPSMGAQYDIRHAVVEGGLSWPNSLQLIHPAIKTLAIKDFKWEKEGGTWKAQNTPLGEGMVDFKAYFQLLKEYQIRVPLSLHLEYPIGGAEHGATQLSVDKEVVFDTMRRDLTTLKKLWQQVG